MGAPSVKLPEPQRRPADVPQPTPHSPIPELDRAGLAAGLRGADCRLLGAGSAGRRAHRPLGAAALAVHRHRRHAGAPARRGPARRPQPDPAAARHLGQPAHLGGLGAGPAPPAPGDQRGSARLRPHRAVPGRRLQPAALHPFRERAARRPGRAPCGDRRQFLRRPGRHRDGAGTTGPRGQADPGRCAGLPGRPGVHSNRFPHCPDAGAQPGDAIPVAPAGHRRQPPQCLWRSVQGHAGAGGPLLRHERARRQPRLLARAFPVPAHPGQRRAHPATGQADADPLGRAATG